MTKILLSALYFLLMPPGGITSLVQKAEVGGGCNEFEETTWDNLTGWTQDSGNDFSADATNDELDYSTHVAQAWIYNDTEATDADHCAMWQAKSIGSNTDVYYIALRFPTSNANFYGVGFDFESGSGDTYVAVYARSSGGASWVADIASTTLSALDAGDYFSACVNGTGNGTVWELWDHGASDPGNCRSDDWGAADWTVTTNPGGSAVDSGTRVGFMMDHYSAGDTSAGTLDEFVGSDY